MFYTTQQQVTITKPAVVPIFANGGAVSISVSIGGTQREMLNVTENDVIIIDGFGLTYQITPSGGAAYEIK